MQRKICLLGAFAVGKSSLTERFVKSIFSERYHSTVGVRIEKRTVELGDRAMDLIIWDLAGEDELVVLRTAYLRGSSGCMLVADGTRPETLDTVIELQKRARAALGNVPFVLVVNKTDRVEDWAIEETQLNELERQGWPVLRTSAKTGEGVKDGFTRLAEAMGFKEELHVPSRNL
jgi:small GTP-binding protein